jgi:hypothetical protein
MPSKYAIETPNAEFLKRLKRLSRDRKAAGRVGPRCRQDSTTACLSALRSGLCCRVKRLRSGGFAYRCAGASPSAPTASQRFRRPVCRRTTSWKVTAGEKEKAGSGRKLGIRLPREQEDTRATSSPAHRNRWLAQSDPFVNARRSALICAGSVAAIPCERVCPRSCCPLRDSLPR